jgi:hypothetical protein
MQETNIWMPKSGNKSERTYARIRLRSFGCECDEQHNFAHQTFNLARVNRRASLIFFCQNGGTDNLQLEKRRQNCREFVLKRVHNPQSTSDRGTFESNAVRLRVRAASLITQCIGTRATSLIAQFHAARDGFDPRQSRKREPHRSSL